MSTAGWASRIKPSRPTLEALAIAREAKYRPGESLALFRLGDTHRKLGQLEKAIEYLEPALAAARAPRGSRGGNDDADRARESRA